MLVKKIITESKEVVEELQLPYCAKNGCFLYRINKDGSILRLSHTKDWAQIDFIPNKGLCYDQTIQQILKGIEIEQEDVLQMAESIHELIGNSVEGKKKMEAV